MSQNKGKAKDTKEAEPKKTQKNENIKVKQEANKQQKHIPQQQQQQQKQLRRVAQRSEMPTDKTQLIQYLSTRIKQAEEALIDTEQLLEQQVKQRQKITKALDERNDQLSKLFQIDQRALPQKIKEKLNEILTTTVTQKIQAEQKLSQEKLKNYQYKSRYDQLRWQDKNNKVKLEEQTKKENELNSQIQKIDNENKSLQGELEALQVQFNKIREQKENLENKYLQMRVALDRMGDVKGVLNRFFGNEDLFDDKMDLKEQKIQKLPQVAKQSPNLPPPSRESRATKVTTNNQKLKPIVKQKVDDDDFWKADFKGKNSGY